MTITGTMINTSLAVVIIICQSSGLTLYAYCCKYNFFIFYIFNFEKTTKKRA